MERVTVFYKLQAHAWHGKDFKRLSKREIELCETFIRAHEHMDDAKFEFTAHRWFLDMPNKPKNLGVMVELLTACKRGESK